MKEEEGFEEFEKIAKEQFEKENKTKKKIVDLLNEFGNCSLKNNYNPLIIDDKNIFVIFELSKIKSSNIREYLEEECPFSLECFSSMIFEMLFINENDFIYENLDEKIICFKTIINTLNYQGNIQEENLISSNYKNKSKNCQIFYDNIFINQFQNEYLGYLCIIALYHNKNTLKFLEFFIRILQNILTIKIDFTLYDVRELSIEKAIDDIIKIFDRKEKVNNIHLTFKENTIGYFHFSEDELKKINGNIGADNQNSDDINNLDDNLEDLNENIDDENEEINVQENINKQNEADNKKEKEEKTEESKNSKQELEEIKNEIKNEIKLLKTNQNILTNQINKVNKKIDMQNNRIKKLNENLYKYKNENSILKREINNLENKFNSERMKSEKKIDNLKKNLEKMQNELIDVRYELKLIQSREAFKAFIDYFYFGLKFHEPLKYSEKIYLIRDKLKKKMKVNNKIKRQIMNLLIEIYNKLYSCNTSAHSIDLKKPIITQILEILGNKDNYGNALEKINKTNMNDVITELISKRDEYYFDKDTLNKLEAQIYQKIPNLETVIFG